MPRLPKTLIQNTPNYKIETPNGFEDFYAVNKIHRDWYVHLIGSDRVELKCSPRHPFFDSNSNIVLAMNLKRGNKIQSKSGFVEIQYAEIIDEPIYLYDIVDSGKDNTYYTNGVLSHNCNFVGSINTLITPGKLRTLIYKEPIESRNGLDIYEQPQEGKIYTIVCDVSHGEGLDYSAFSVIDSSTMPYRQVAKYRSSNVTPLLYPNFILDVAKHYNGAYVLVEVNDVGQQVADILHYDLEYENLMMLSVRGRAGQVLSGGFGIGKSQVGIKTSKKVKQIGCMNLKNMIEDDKLLLQDFDTIAELTSFVSKGYAYQAEAGYNDDLVMTLVLFAWCTTQPYFKEMTDVDLRKRVYEEKIKTVEDEVLPFGFVDDGVTIEDKYVDEEGQSWDVVSTWPNQ